MLLSLSLTYKNVVNAACVARFSVGGGGWWWGGGGGGREGGGVVA